MYIGVIGNQNNPKEIQDLNKKPQHMPNKALSKATKSKRVQNPVQKSKKPPKLLQVINAWPSLPEHIEKTIITLIQT